MNYGVTALLLGSTSRPHFADRRVHFSGKTLHVVYQQTVTRSLIYCPKKLEPFGYITGFVERDKHFFSDRQARNIRPHPHLSRAGCLLCWAFPISYNSYTTRCQMSTREVTRYISLCDQSSKNRLSSLNSTVYLSKIFWSSRDFKSLEWSQPTKYLHLNVLRTKAGGHVLNHRSATGKH